MKRYGFINNRFNIDKACKYLFFPTGKSGGFVRATPFDS